MDVTQTLATRKTSKIISDLSESPNVEPVDSSVLDALAQCAGNAPFHYACTNHHRESLSSPVPWRAYKLERSGCVELMNNLLDAEDQTKIPNMLAAAQFLVQVTWLPDEGTLISEDPVKEGAQFEGTLRNMEHIAAASAFAQSLLLAATAAGFRTYWSSGGPLRSGAVFDKLGISRNEVLIGSIFLFPSEIENAETRPGSMADKRGDLHDWSQWCEIT